MFTNSLHCWMIVYPKSLYITYTPLTVVVEPLMVTTNITKTIGWPSYSQPRFVTISSIPLLFGHVWSDSYVGWVSDTLAHLRMAYIKSIKNLGYMTINRYHFDNTNLEYCKWIAITCCGRYWSFSSRPLSFVIFNNFYLMYEGYKTSKI